MRKLISLGLLALVFSLFSSQVLAGKVSYCEDQKEELKALGLYGLCNAYWNADEGPAQDRILENYNKRVAKFGGPPMPGTVPEPEDGTFDCLCWDSFTLKEVCELGKPTAMAGISNVFAAVTYVDFAVFEAELFGAGPSEVPDQGNVCEHGFQDLLSQEFDPESYDREERLNSEDFGACLAEVEVMFTLYSEDCETL